ncbi:hypothetical protein [Alteromonas facilis]|uniref:hypothetical protein n=1 Tax=Alteromonas facilis TaxID=2048004 RepID=UPI000C28D3E7|nr:hypothetical protein [Alteromonas facilis]
MIIPRALKSVLGLSLLIGSVFASASETEKDLATEDRIQALYVGQVLYHYFQQQPLDTLHAVAITRHKGVPQDQLERMQLVEGGASLQLGMTHTATDLLQDLLAQTQAPELQAQAWFWLAHTAFQQGQYDVSQTAAETLFQPALMEFVEPAQIDTLAYQAAYYQIQHQSENWQSILASVEQSSDWYPYLIANVGIQLFNQSQFEPAAEQFIAAIEAVQAPTDSDWDWSLDWLNPANASWWPWAETVEIVDTPFQERNALLDRLYYLLGQSFVQQNNFNAAFNAFKQIQSDGIYAEEGLLAYGWSLAKEERWPEAMPVWRYLQQQGKGLPALQATHALAYGYEQLTDYRQAYDMLAQSLSQLTQARESLETLRSTSQSERFFSHLSQSDDELMQALWPREHQDILIDVLSGDNQPNTAKQLATLLQLDDMQRLIQQQRQRVEQLHQLLNERENTYKLRAQSLPLEDAKHKLQQAKDTLTRLGSVVERAPNEPALLASAQQQEWLERLAASEQRLAHIRSLDGVDEQGVEALATRVERLQGLLAWQLEEQKMSVLQSHKQSFDKAQTLYQQASERYQALYARAGNETELLDNIRIERQQLSELNAQYTQKSEQTRLLQTQLISALSRYVDSRITERDAILLEQVTATRLAMLRMQDLHFTRSANELRGLN